MAFLVNGTTVVDNARGLTNITGTDSPTMTALALELVAENSVAAGTTPRMRDNVQRLKTGPGYIVTFGPVNVVQRGTITFATNVLISNAAGPGTFALNRRRNGGEVTVWAQTINTTGYTGYSSTQSVLPGDQYLFYIQGGQYVSGKSLIQTTAYSLNQELRTDLGSVWIPSGAFSWYHLY